jgi:hypothetical protein
MTTPPIIILGSERSGSNLLRKLLGNHSRIAAPRPAHFYNYFFSHLHHYGPLVVEANTRRLFEDLVAAANHSRSDWGLTVSFEDFARQHSTGTFFGLVDGLHRVMGSSLQKDMYFCKDNDMQRYALALRLARPDIRFVYLHRDPRDTTASWLKTPAFQHHAMDTAYTWLNDQAEVFALRDAHGIPIHEISYVDLTSRTEETMTGVLRFAGLEPETPCFALQPDTEQDSERAALWKNLNQPILQNNFNKFAKELSEEQIEIVETICKPLMTRLGYALVTPGKFRFSSRRFKLRRWWDLRQFRREHAADIAQNTKEVLNKNALVRQLIRKRAREVPSK